MMCRRAHASAGFTLVEVLISLSILSMLIALLMAGYAQGLSLWERGVGQSATWQKLEYRHELLRQLFLHARLAEYRGDGLSHVHFYADQDQIQFTSGKPLLDFAGHSRPVRLLFERQSDGLFNVVYQEGGRHQDQGRGITWQDDRRVTLIEGLGEFSARYLAPPFPLPPDLWSARLSAEDHLRYRDERELLTWYDGAILWKAPMQITFNFEDQDGEKQYWAFNVPRENDAWSLTGLLEEYN